jgi:hypothetical protein
LLRVGPDLRVGATVVLDRPPRHLLTLADLDPAAAASQRPSGTSVGPAPAEAEPPQREEAGPADEQRDDDDDGQRVH